MIGKPSKRRYRNSLDQVEEGIRACWTNATDLLSASDRLFEAELHAPALSVAVLALEELAKMIAMDGLLFARHDDEKAERYKRANKNHAVKLSMFEMFPLLLGNLASADPRFGNEKRFNMAIAISIEQLRADGNALMDELGGEGFQRLDEWKQRGFYTACTEGGFVAPRSAVPRTLVDKVRRLVWRATTTVDFVLKSDGLERYIQAARSIRSTLSEDQHRELETLAEEVAANLFHHPDDDDLGGFAENLA